MKPVSPAAAWGAWGTCAAIWGSTFLAIAYGNDHLPPVWGAALRLLLASTLLGGYLALRRQALPRGRALLAATQFGLFQFGINLPLLYLGETQVPSGLSAVIFSTIPLSTALLAWIFGLERLRPARIVGAVVAVLGVALIFSSQLGSRAKPWPLLFVLLSAWSACLGTVLLKRGPRQSPVAANAVGAAVGAAVCLVWSRALGEPMILPHDWGGLLPVLYLAIVGSVVAFVLMAWLINQWDVTRISYISVVVPLVALTLGVLLRHERVSARSLAGALVVLAGVVIGLELWRSRSRAPAGQEAGP